MSLKQRFRNIKKLPSWIYIAPALLIKGLRRVMKVEIRDPTGSLKLSSLPVVTVTWHNRLLLFPALFDIEFRRRTKAVISASRDGQYIADLIKQFDVDAVRGSSSKKGEQALRGAFKAIEDGCCVSFTPDGPRGPKYSMGRGPVYLASQTGAPLVPISIDASDYWELRSWDRFQIPKPWAKVVVTIGEPMKIPKDLSEEELAKWSELARERLMAITKDLPGRD